MAVPFESFILPMILQWQSGLVSAEWGVDSWDLAVQAWMAVLSRTFTLPMSLQWQSRPISAGARFLGLSVQAWMAVPCRTPALPILLYGSFQGGGDSDMELAVPTTHHDAALFEYETMS